MNLRMKKGRQRSIYKTLFLSLPLFSSVDAVCDDAEKYQADALSLSLSDFFFLFFTYLTPLPL